MFAKINNYLQGFNMVKVCSRPQTIYAVGVAMTYGVLVVKTIVVRGTCALWRVGSTPTVRTFFRGISSAGRTSDLHSEGQRFDSAILH